MDEDKPDYATVERLAIYLEIGWSDYLHGATRPAAQAARKAYPNPFRDLVPPDFYGQVGELTQRWADFEAHSVKRYCDVGGATGRMVHEIERRSTDIETLTLVEPSMRFCEWAARLLGDDNPLPEVPVVGSTGRPQRATARSRPSPLRDAEHRLAIFNGTLEDFRPANRFDLVTCLNVVDRHFAPAALTRELERIMNPDGLLVMSSPFDFAVDTTPDRAAWIDDLNVLFEQSDSWRHVGEDTIYYEYRSFNRCWVRFAAQVVAKRWTGA